jgi:hypothetical protein
VSLFGIAIFIAVLLDAAKGENPMALLGLLPLLAVGCIALACAGAGYLVRKGGRIGGWIAILTAGLLTVYWPPSGTDAPPLPADAPAGLGILNLGIVVLNGAFIALNEHYRSDHPQLATPATIETVGLRVQVCSATLWFTGHRIAPGRDTRAVGGVGY